MTFARARRPLLWAAAATTLALTASDALAQGCAQCGIAASQAPGGRSMNAAILVLLVPTVSIFVGILLRARKGR